MCGLMGVYSKTWGSIEYELFRRLLYINVWRGDDSTGVVRVNNDNTILRKKTLDASPEFIRGAAGAIVHEAKGESQKHKPLLLMGHCRAATQGSVTVENAHPFNFDNVVGMHNGTIHGKFEGRDAFGTDSEALYSLINKVGLEKAINTIEQEATSTAYALQWLNKKEGTLNFFKNDKRPLYFAYLYGKSTLIWSSEKAAVEFVCRSKNLSPLPFSKDMDDVWTLSDHTHFSLPVGGVAGDFSGEKVEVKKKSYVYPISQYPTYNTSQTGGTSTTHSTASSKTHTGTGGTRVGTTTGSTPTANQSGFGVGRYKDHRTNLGKEALEQLAWLFPESEKKTTTEPKAFSVADLFEDLDELPSDRPGDTETDDVPWDDRDEKPRIKTYPGHTITESEFRYRLSSGCSCCGKKLRLSDPHDYAEINKIRWGDQLNWYCDSCYETSDGDWVRCVVDDSWDFQTPTKEKEKGVG